MKWRGREVEMPSIALTSFLKILPKGTPQKVSEYGKYLGPGGYDFYWSLKEAAHNFTVGNLPYEDCATPIKEISRDAEKKHNLAGLASLGKWKKKAKVTKFFDPPAGSCTSPGGYLTVKLEPEFGAFTPGVAITSEGDVAVLDQRRLIQIWNVSGAPLSRTAASIGVFLLQKYLAIGDYADCKGGVLDLRRCELILADKLPPNLELMVAAEFAWADNFFKTHQKAA